MAKNTLLRSHLVGCIFHCSFLEYAVINGEAVIAYPSGCKMTVAILTKYNKRGCEVKVREIIDGIELNELSNLPAAKQQSRQLSVQPAMVKQQARVGQVVGQIAASDQQQAPTELDKVLAMRSYANMKKRADRTYAERLRQQLANAERAAR